MQVEPHLLLAKGKPRPTRVVPQEAVVYQATQIEVQPEVEQCMQVK